MVRETYMEDYKHIYIYMHIKNERYKDILRIIMCKNINELNGLK